MTDIKSATTMADALAKVDQVQGSDLDAVETIRVARGVLSNQEARYVARELIALRALAEAVRASLTAFSEMDVETLAATALEFDYEFDSGDMLSERQREVLEKAHKVFSGEDAPAEDYFEVTPADWGGDGT